MKKTTKINYNEVEKPVKQLIVSLAATPESSSESHVFARCSLLETAEMFAEIIASGCRVMTFHERDTEELQHPHIHIIYTNSKP